jgi:hypothetical protein
LGRWMDGGGCATAGLLLGDFVGLLALVLWWVGGVVTALVQACWCQRGGT